MRSNHAFIVPFPDSFAGTCFHRSGANISRNAPISYVKIFDTCARQSFLQIALTQFRSVHADWIVSNINDALHSRSQESVEQVFCWSTFITDREKVSLFRQTRFIP